jgi:4-carboxymuconolactone decarboxylase
MIAGQVGYSTAVAFDAAFRREYGIPPGVEQSRHQARQGRVAFDIADATVIELPAHVEIPAAITSGETIEHVRETPVTVHPPTDDRRWGGRLPLAEAGTLDQEQRAVAEQLHLFAVPWAEQAGFTPTTDDGYLIGPWNVLVHRPQPARGFNEWVKADQMGSSLPATVREVVILTVGVAWQAVYELYAHTAVARHVGTAQPVIDGVLNHTPNDDFSAAELAAHRFTDELVRARTVTDETYGQTLEVFGQRGVIDMVHLIGIYLATSALLNAFEIPAPDAC